eukprot:2958080-Alexandrium_andersonii.AAC.1
MCAQGSGGLNRQRAWPGPTHPKPAQPLDSCWGAGSCPRSRRPRGTWRARTGVPGPGRRAPPSWCPAPAGLGRTLHDRGGPGSVGRRAARSP